MSSNDAMDMPTEPAEPRTELMEPTAVAKLPVVVPPAKDRRAKWPWLKRALLFLALLPAAVGGGYWWLHSGDRTAAGHRLGKWPP